jgi:PadR family transcriptional regulator PadR
MRITEPAYFILTALLDAPHHGYGILTEVQTLSEGRVSLKIGTLYGVLERLNADGHIELDREEVERGRLRRYYRITGAGRRLLEAEARLQAVNARTVLDRLTAGGRKSGAGGTA